MGRQTLLCAQELDIIKLLLLGIEAEGESRVGDGDVFHRSFDKFLCLINPLLKIDSRKKQVFVFCCRKRGVFRIHEVAPGGDLLIDLFDQVFKRGVKVGAVFVQCLFLF